MLPGKYVVKKWINKFTKSRVLNEASLTLIWVDFLGVDLEWGAGGGGGAGVKLPRIKIML